MQADFLDQEGHARERPIRQALVKGALGLRRKIAHDAVELGIQLLDGGQRVLHQLRRRDFALAHQLGQPERVIVAII